MENGRDEKKTGEVCSIPSQFGAISQAKTNYILAEEPARRLQLNTKRSLYE